MRVEERVRVTMKATPVPLTHDEEPLARHIGVPLKRRKLAHRQRLVTLALVFSDILLAFLVWEGASLLQGIWGHGPLSGLMLAGIVTNTAAWVGLRALLGLYPGYGLDQVEELRRQTYALLGSLAITSVFAIAFQIGDSVSRLLSVVGFLSLLFLSPVVRYFVKRGLARVGLWGKPVIVLGAHEAGAHMLRVLQQEWQMGFMPVRVFDHRLAPIGGAVEGVPYGGTLDDAMDLAANSGVNTAIFAMPHTRREELAELVNQARISFRQVIIIPNLVGVTNSAVTARDFAGTFGVQIKHNLLDPRVQKFKRALDIVLTLTGGILILPLLLIISLLVWLELRGPIFYTDYRLGKDGKLFSCVKFRTMVTGAEALLERLLQENVQIRDEYLKYHKLRHDPRITRVGRFLRKTSLDELPQLWNVLRGEMSLVGPRPYLPRESEDVGESQGEILRVRPGITGPWQVGGRSHTSFGERVRMDSYYVLNWSIWLDFVLLSRTVVTVVFSRSAY